MPVRVQERDLILPSLRLAASRSTGEITTAELITELTDMFLPDGEDAEILEGRQDTKFSQKVRNLVSHRAGRQTMFSRGYADHSERSSVRALPSGSGIARLISWLEPPKFSITWCALIPHEPCISRSSRTLYFCAGRIKGNALAEHPNPVRGAA